MSEERIITTPNPATPSSGFPLTPFTKPASGNLTLTATITRDPGDDTPVLVRIVDDEESPLASIVLSTPAGSQPVSLTFSSPETNDCQIGLGIECEALPPVPTYCCEAPIPAILHMECVDPVPPDEEYVPPIACSQYFGRTGTLVFNPSTQSWEGSIDLCGGLQQIQLQCDGGTWTIQSSPLSDIGVGLISCDPLNLFALLILHTFDECANCLELGIRITA
jgi:hypothetical protein